MLANRTVVYTLHYITWRDEGTFMTNSLDPDCMWYITVSILKDGKQSYMHVYIYTWKKVRNTSSSNFMFLEFQLPVAWRYQIFDCIHL